MTELVELGRATTRGQAVPLGVDDPVIAARAVRRALAAAGRRAVDVSTVIVAANEPIEAEVLAAFARRALGPNGSAVRVIGLVADALEAAGLAERASSAAGATEAPGRGVVIAIGLSPDRTTEARCLGTASRQGPEHHATPHLPGAA